MEQQIDHARRLVATEQALVELSSRGPTPGSAVIAANNGLSRFGRIRTSPGGSRTQYHFALRPKLPLARTILRMPRGLVARGRSDRLRRAAVLPDLPTVVEKSLPAAQAHSWTAFFLLRRARRDCAKAHDATVQAMDTQAVRDQLQSVGSVIVAPDRRSPDYLAGFVTSEIEKWAVPIRACGAVVD
jgi:hypothetical protein